MRISRSVLREAGGETPPAYSPVIRADQLGDGVIDAKDSASFHRVERELSTDRSTADMLDWAPLRTMTKLVLVMGVVILLAGSLGWLYNCSLRLYRAVVPPGNFFVVEGRSMHLYCIGAGSPTIVIESGLGEDWIGWQAVQTGLARVTRVCSYDRAGLGWSDPDPGRRDAVTISDQLHELLQRAAITDRLLLVGRRAVSTFADSRRNTPPTLWGLCWSILPRQSPLTDHRATERPLNSSRRGTARLCCRESKMQLACLD